MSAPSRSAAPYTALGTDYARAVTTGKIPACQWVQRACQRQLDDLERWKAKDSPFYFDTKAAERICDIVERFPHIRGEWAQARQRLKLEGWQAFVLTTVFGWKCRATDSRRFRVAYSEIPRKNAKSTITSAVGLYLTACDGEHGAHVVSAANTRDQAKIVFTDAQLMARREPGFCSRFGVEVLAHAIAQTGTASRFEALSAEHSNLDGLNLHAALIDELHAHPTRGLWDVLETATGSRHQSLIWAITTAGVNRASVCWEQRSYAIKILQRLAIDETYFGIIYTADDDDDPFEETTWIKANPNWGVSIYPEGFRANAARAMSMPSAQQAFFTKHLNIWINADHSWIDIRQWMRCANEELDQTALAAQPCYVGIDLAFRSDIAAVVALFPPAGKREKWVVIGRYYLPESEAEKSENTHYQGWESKGQLVLTPGSITDYRYIVRDLAQWLIEFDVREIAIDPWKNVSLINMMKEDEGITVPIIDTRQVKSVMSPAMFELEALITGQKIEHDGGDVLTWMLSNVVAHADPRDQPYPLKESAEKKIDGVLALLMALDRATRQTQNQPACASGGIFL